MRLRFIVLLLLVVLAIGGFSVFDGNWYRSVDRAWIAMRHLNQRIHYGMGYQLPGTPELDRLDERLAAKGLERGAPIYMRIFKSELTLELWMKRKDRFVLFASYPICFWSGRLGPKLKEGDRQAPEGFYTVSQQQLNPNSRWHRSFNLGFPNLYDRVHERTGSFLMVHGGCSSVGCYAMTNGIITELWDLLNAALDQGQERFAVHIYPFRLSEARLEAYADHEWADYWRQLKPAYDLFETMRVPPEISLCQRQYVVRKGEEKAASPEALAEHCPPPRSATLLRHPPQI